MPQYYCDYCDTYQHMIRHQSENSIMHDTNTRRMCVPITNSSRSNKHSLIDQKIKEHLSGQAALQQVGVAFNQHLASVPALPRSRLPILPPPGMPIGAPSEVPAGTPMIPGFRPPGILPPPTGAQGYSAIPFMPSASAAWCCANTTHAQWLASAASCNHLWQ